MGNGLTFYELAKIEAKQKAESEVALNMFNSGMAPSDISKFLNVTEDELQTLLDMKGK